MKKINLIKINDCKDLLKTTPKKNHYNKLINEDCVFIKNGKPAGIYIKIDNEKLKLIRKASLTTKLSKSSRTRGIPTQSSIFGSLPRIARRNDFCRYSAHTKNEIKNTNIMFNFMADLIDIYKKHLPEQYERDLKLIQESVADDYAIKKDSPFLTCNINVNHAIKYHRDSGNFKQNLSNVLILKDGIIGGELVFPEYGFALSQEDGYLAIFDGQKEIHGVMPIFQTKENPYRASIVYYSLEQMKHCYPYKMEVERLQKVSTERAIKRANNINPTKK
tara:strand:+ start:313 stop:1140 length:828 start_codon:yes stop_codon:yes gene_type:complete